MMYLLDTNVVSELRKAKAGKADKRVAAWATSVPVASLFLSVITVHEIEIGPPLLKPAPKLVRQPARIEMIENEMAKLENPDQDRFRSCLYPSLARCFSSSVRCGTSCSGRASPSGLPATGRSAPLRESASAT